MVAERARISATWPARRATAGRAAAPARPARDRRRSARPGGAGGAAPGARPSAQLRRLGDRPLQRQDRGPGRRPAAAAGRGGNRPARRAAGSGNDRRREPRHRPLPARSWQPLPDGGDGDRLARVTSSNGMIDIAQGESGGAELPEPLGSGHGFRRPVVVVRGDTLNRGRISSVVCVPLTHHAADGSKRFTDCATRSPRPRGAGTTTRAKADGIGHPRYRYRTGTMSLAVVLPEAISPIAARRRKVTGQNTARRPDRSLGRLSRDSPKPLSSGRNAPRRRLAGVRQQT